jgi:hypothetical protein
MGGKENTMENNDDRQRRLTKEYNDYRKTHADLHKSPTTKIVVDERASNSQRKLPKWVQAFNARYQVQEKLPDPEFKQCPACFGTIPYKATACMHCGYSPNKNKALGAIGLWLFFH